MPDCWPPCSPWCTCDTTTGQCTVRPVTINAIRLRTPDGRFLQSPASGRLLVAATVATPGPAETFLFAPGMTGPRTSGDAIQLRACDATFAPSGAQVRVDHSVQVLPRGGKNAPPLVTYEIGGPGTTVFVSGPLPVGYPAYRGDDPAEWTFDILKAGGGPIADGDAVSLRITSNLGRTFFFRVTGAQPGAGVNGDATSQGAAGTVFIVTFNEVMAGAGWRPAATPCRSCADVVGSVSNQSSKAAIAGAFVEALDVFESHPFTGSTASNGRFALADAEGRKCIPSGAVRFRARANRHQPKIHGPLTLPANGFVDITIELECTNVSGVVVDQADRPLAGVAVALVDITSHAPVLAPDGQPYVTTTAMDGSFIFRCVPHGAVAAWLMSEPTRFHSIAVPPEGANVKIVTQAVCGNLIGTVKNAVTLAAVPMATVAIIGQPRTTQTNANGEFRLNCVRPAGTHQLLAAAAGFTLGGGFGLVPMSGDSAAVDIRLQPLAVSSIAIRLDWGALPGDLDLRFTGPDNMGGRFQVVYAFPTPVPYVRLDQDVSMGFGPETITLSSLTVGTFVPGIYRVWVLNVTALQSGGAGSTFDMSNAVVTVFTIGAAGMNQVGRFEVAQAAGMQDSSLWHPCDLDVTANGTVTVVPVQLMEPGGPAVIV
jgi:hypothetical protein